jgi:aspartyl/glutamyl-tRNA(Asn/Gln) amidotransferase C subunit
MIEESRCPPGLPKFKNVWGGLRQEIMSKKLFSAKTTKKMALLSDLSIDPKEQTYFTKQFNETLKIINKLNKLNTENVTGTYNVTGLFDTFRKDEVTKDRMLSQKQALSNAKKTYKGYFVVKAILNEK